MLRQVKTRYGIVEGTISEGGYALFKGIPYAAPPVGALRWRPSVPPAPWEGVRLCDIWGNACIQETGFDSRSGYGREFYARAEYSPSMSEDCLYLNIWTPAHSTEDKLPVMMWMHGGGVQSGYGHEMEFDGDEFASRGVILVTIHYRLNVFGYFSHLELEQENEYSGSGNYGLHDQLQALRWIQENIAAFGGDPDNVTVAGQSGGGRSAQAIACSPLAKGMVRRAIIQSAGGIATTAGRQSREDAESKGRLFMEYLHCKTVDEMRMMDAIALHSSFRRFIRERLKPREAMSWFNISTDGHALPISLEDAILQGKQDNLDYMLGCTTGDRYLGPMLESLAGWAYLQNDQGKKPAYFYRFERDLPDPYPLDGDMLKGAFHSSELWYMFGTLGRCWRPMTEGDWELSQIMLDAWANFARTGNPNGASVPRWEVFQNEAPVLMSLNVSQCGGCGMRDADPYGDLQERIIALLPHAAL